MLIKVPTKICFETLRLSGFDDGYFKTMKFQCLICAKIYQDEKGLNIHMKDIHNEVIDLETHKSFGVENNRLTCDSCDKTFHLLSNCKKHFESFHANNPHKCQNCSTTFQSLEDLQKHNCVQKDSLFECNQCKKLYSSKKTLKLHIKDLHEEAPLIECQFESCDKKFKLKNLKKHLQRHRKSLEILESEEAEEKPPASEEKLSDYEQIREANISQRKEFIKQLALKDMFSK